MEILDPQVVNLAKAIRQTETGGDQNARGASGEFGAYQFMPDTWTKTAPKYGVNVPLEKSTLEDQNKVAYNQIKEWKSQGYNPGQIASLWNSGKPEWKGNVGVNKAGVKFDTPKYVDSVYKAYQTIKQGGEVQMDVNNPSSIAGTQVEQPQKEGYQPTFPITGKEGIAGAILKPLGNMPGGAVNLAKNIVEQVNPINTAKNISETISTLSDIKGAQPSFLDTLKEIPKSAYETVIPQFIQQLISGKGTEALKSVAEDPIGQLYPILAGGKGIAEKIGAGAKFDSAISGIAKPITNPPSAIKAVIEAPKKVLEGTARYTAGQAFGVNPSTISETLKNPSAFTRESIRNANDARMALGNEIKTALDEKINQLGETGSQYSTFRSSKTPVNVDFNFLLEEIQNKTGLQMGRNGEWKTTTTSKVYKPADVNKIQNFYDEWQPVMNRGTMTPEEFLTMRSRLADLGRFENAPGKSFDVDNAAKGIRADLNDRYRPQVKGLEKTDAEFEAQKTELQNLKKGLLDKDNNLSSGAISKIANATGKGKTEFLNKIEELSPGITQRIGIVKALEDWQSAEGIKVGTYGRGGITVGGFAFGGPVGAIIAQILTSPEVAIPILRAFAKVSGISEAIINTIIEKLNNAIALSPAELKIFTGALMATAGNEKTPLNAFSPIPVNDQNQQALLDEIEAQKNTPKEEGYVINDNDLTVTAPNGKIYKFKTLGALNAFKREAGL